jgi:hypothetical protein
VSKGVAIEANFLGSISSGDQLCFPKYPTGVITAPSSVNKNIKKNYQLLLTSEAEESSEIWSPIGLFIVGPAEGRRGCDSCIL